MQQLFEDFEARLALGEVALETVELVVHRVALAAAFDDLACAVLGLFVELVARFFEFLDVALKLVVFDLAGLTGLRGGLTIMRE